jgi:serine protease
MIQVRFREGTDVHAPADALPDALRRSVLNIRPLLTLSEQQLDDLRVKGEKLSGRALPRLALWYRITLNPGVDPVAFIQALREAPYVDVAEHEPLPAPPPAITGDFSHAQGYLGAATDGIDAKYAWTIPGGNAAGITIYDVEFNWLQTHEDLTRASGIGFLLSAGDWIAPPGYIDCPAPCDSVNREHGTAVLGELIADRDILGVTGIAWGANVGLAPSCTAILGLDIANAILLAVADGEAGDVILIEQQSRVCNLPDSDNLGPVEWSQPVFDAIQIATANGIVVVEAAGNGGVNLDGAECGDAFDRTIRDSGAIIVGAGEPPGSGDDRHRARFSSYGERVDVQGWGDSVMTTGYGMFYSDPDDPADPNRWYVSTFGGTSGASAMVAGAVADIQGIARNRFGAPLTPVFIRELLKETGSRQLGNTAENIGPRPNLRRAMVEGLATQKPIYLPLAMTARPGSYPSVSR